MELRWKHGTTQLSGTNPRALTASVFAQLTPSATFGSVTSCTREGPPTAVGQTSTCQHTYTPSGSQNQTNSSKSFTSVNLAVPCPGCDLTDPTIGQKFAGTASTMATHSYCDPVSMCKVHVKQASSVNGQAMFVGEKSSSNCDSEDPESDAPDMENQEQCTTSGAYQFCVNASGGGQCGYVNDSFVCLNKIPQGGCAKLAGGDMVCEASAGTPPAPDNGTPGRQAEPDEEIQHTTTSQGTPSNPTGSSVTNNYNYYSSTTVSGSARDSDTTTPETEGPPGSGGDSDGDDDEDEPGEESGVTGGGNCTTPPVCTGDAIQCAILQQTYNTRCSPLLGEEEIREQLGVSEETLPGAEDDAFDVSEGFDDSGWLGSRACPPNQTINLGSYGTITVPLSDKCWFFSLIGALVLIIAYLQAARIVAGGF